MLGLVPQGRLEVLAQRQYEPDGVLGERLVEDVSRIGEHHVAGRELREEHSFNAGGSGMNPAQAREVPPVVAEVAAAHVPDQQRFGCRGLGRRRRSRVNEDVPDVGTGRQHVTAGRITLNDTDEQGHVLVVPGSGRLMRMPRFPADGTVILCHVDRT
jgi:hypothetical protein